MAAIAAEACHLVVREVPRHHAEQYAQGGAANDRRALGQDVERRVAGDLFPVVRVVLRDVRGKVHLAKCRGERLAHLAHDDRG
jgi:hypothetical protein